MSRDDETRAVADFDQLTALITSRPEIKAALERIAIDVSEGVRLLIANGVDAHNAAAAIGGQVTSNILLTIATIGTEAQEAPA